jgi:uncharacterized protein
MKTGKLPNTIDPILLAKKQASLQGELSMADMARLPIKTAQFANILVEFGQDEGRTYYIKGRIDAVIPLICERCNQEMAYKMKESFALRPVLSDNRSVKQGDTGYEPLVTNGELVDLRELIEDELLLNIPVVPKHEDENCLTSDFLVVEDEFEHTVKDNPFKGLADLVNDGKQS